MALSKEALDIVANNTVTSVSKLEFRKVLKESKSLAKKENRNVRKIANKFILKQRLAQLYCSGSYTIKQIASMLMVSEYSIKKLLKEEEVLSMINEYQAEEKELIDSGLKRLRSKALDVAYELLDSDEDTVRLQAYKDILDRTGFKADNNQNININVSYEQQLQQLAEGIEFDYEVNEINLD